ncbi:hydrogenase nickel incorporation protein HypB [Chloroflexota bacterium]
MEIKVLKDILNANNQLAEQNRRLLLGKNIMTINLMSSPGAGKTTLILRTIEVLQGKARIGVIEGDISSSIDSKKISQAEVPVIQINTGGDCHLDASMVKSALTGLPLDSIDILFIENVGNLICPAGFDLGEYLKVIILSAPEGDDKPYKYPSLFTIAEALLVNKIDLLPYINFDMGSFQRAIKGLNQKATIFEISGTTGQGIGEWGSWVMEQLKKLRSEKERAS